MIGSHPLLEVDARVEPFDNDAVFRYVCCGPASHVNADESGGQNDFLYFKNF
jgi:hypothetical protein